LDIYSEEENMLLNLENGSTKRSTKPRKTMSVHEMRDLLGIKKTESYWLIHKNYFETKLVAGKMRVDIASFEKWYANQFKHKKVNGEAPGRELKEKVYSFQEASNILGIGSHILYEIWKSEGRRYIVVDFVMYIPKEEFEAWYEGQDTYKKEEIALTIEDMKKNYVPIEEAAQRLNISLEEMKAMTLSRRNPIFHLRRFNNKKWISKRSLKLYINKHKQPENNISKEEVPTKPTTSMESRECISRQEAADLAGVSVSTITKWIQCGNFPGKHTRKVLRIPRVEFMEWLDKKEKGEG